ncbi:hypothetical protein BDY21DRAFT_394697 [Lineolata rhizophorae]|uniref:Uncharacterized protein n=1 Tax=Lineolata rhizophorae TaxID=578093 RepID=A0A6A6NWS2_9PEZI|nr:hypothetical protein BDY21DRAFT_394697 [Lineolata rhizophorae]
MAQLSRLESEKQKHCPPRIGTCLRPNASGRVPNRVPVLPRLQGQARRFKGPARPKEAAAAVGSAGRRELGALAHALPNTPEDAPRRQTAPTPAVSRPGLLTSRKRARRERGVRRASRRLAGLPYGRSKYTFGPDVDSFRAVWVACSAKPAPGERQGKSPQGKGGLFAREKPRRRPPSERARRRLLPPAAAFCCCGAALWLPPRRRSTLLTHRTTPVPCPPGRPYSLDNGHAVGVYIGSSSVVLLCFPALFAFAFVSDKPWPGRRLLCDGQERRRRRRQLRPDKTRAGHEPPANPGPSAAVVPCACGRTRKDRAPATRRPAPSRVIVARPNYTHRRCLALSRSQAHPKPWDPGSRLPHARGAAVLAFFAAARHPRCPLSSSPPSSSFLRCTIRVSVAPPSRTGVAALRTPACTPLRFAAAGTAPGLPARHPPGSKPLQTLATITAKCTAQAARVDSAKA